MSKKCDIEHFQNWLLRNQLRYVDMLAWYELQALEFVMADECDFPNTAFHDGYWDYNERAEKLWSHDDLGYDYRRWYEAGALAELLEREIGKCR